MNKIILVVLLLSIPLVCFAQDNEFYTSQVVRIVEGDIIELINGETIRLIGIDAPEVNTAQGQRALEYLKKIGILYKNVLLQFDTQERDRYGRLLAYAYFDLGQLKDDVYAPEFERYFYYNEYKFLFLNATLLNSGYAQPMIIPPNERFADLFRHLYKEAKEGKRGLWEVEGSN